MNFRSLFFGLLIGVGITCLVLLRTDTAPTSPTTTDDNCADFAYLSDTACETPVISKIPYSNLKLTIETYISKKKEEGVLTDIGFFFRDLNNGPTLGINEHAEFVPASMLKVAVLVAYLDVASENPNLLDTTLSVNSDYLTAQNSKFTQNYLPTEIVSPDTPYTVKELLRRSIVYSDNVAAMMLDEYLEKNLSTDKNMLVEAFRALGLLPNVEVTDFVLSTKRYAQIFSTLYFSSYLSPELSNFALSLLTQSVFTQGLVAGVPTSTLVAHKFGERSILPTDASQKEIKQLHDCGIVYYPKNPYLLCIMTQGSKYSDLEKVISDISAFVYSEVDSRKISIEKMP